MHEDFPAENRSVFRPSVFGFRFQYSVQSGVCQEEKGDFAPKYGEKKILILRKIWLDNGRAVCYNKQR